MSFPKPYADTVAKLRVPGGFLMVAAFLWLAAPTWTSLAIGLPISVIGLALRAWAAGHLERIVRWPRAVRMLTCAIRCTSERWRSPRDS